MLGPRALAFVALLAASWSSTAAAKCSSYSTRFKMELTGVCVCTASDCDSISNDYQSLGADQVGVFTTSLAGDRLAYGTVKTSVSPPDTEATLVLDTAVTYQKIVGFGGAFTDSTSINVYKLTEELQEKILEAYYGETGIEYTLGRVPIGSTDFSESVYSYNPSEGDLEMTNFSIAIDKSNATFKIPFIKRALAKTKRAVPLFASSWAPPAWMTREKRVENSRIIGEPGEPYWKALALYYSRFVDEYKKEGIDFWAMTTQNEPVEQALAPMAWQQLRFNHTQERDFIKFDLGPRMQQNHPELKIMIMDDQKDMLPEWTAALDDPTSKTYVAGVGVHWYKNLDFVSELSGDFDKLAAFHAKHPDVFILATEACAGAMIEGIGTGRGVKITEPEVMWKRSENYARDIINDLANFAVGWTDWNLVLDTNGGPNWVNNVVDAPIIVDEVGGEEFYKQGLYYVMGHFSKFLPADSVRVALNLSVVVGKEAAAKLDRVAFLTPEQQLVVILQNRANVSMALTLRDAQGKRDAVVTLPANAVQTILFGTGSGGGGNGSAGSVAPAPNVASVISSSAMGGMLVILGLVLV